MQLVADESVDRPVIERLRRDGHTVIAISELRPGATDDEVLKAADDAVAVLLTTDKDFGELVHRMGRAYQGVVLLRLAGLTAAAKQDAVSAALRDHAAEIAGKFCVIQPGSVRIR